MSGATRWIKDAARMALLLALILLGGLIVNALLLGFAFWKTAGTAETPSLSEYESALIKTDMGYMLPEALCDELDEKGCWVMLIGGDGSVVWQHGKPEEIADHFSLPQVAGFTRWYLMDYPVRVRAVDDDLLVMASPKNSVWKYDASMPLPTLLFWPAWLLITLVCNFLLIFLLSVGMTKRRYQTREAARTEWIAAVSHDVRTPLSMVLGYADSLENDPALTQKQRAQASQIRQKGEELRGLIADLNLTNRLEHSMEPLMLNWVFLPALVREVVATTLNEQQSDDRYMVESQIAPGASPWLLRGDPMLLTRMLKNLIGNSIRHNPAGCTVTVSLDVEKTHRLTLTVRDDGVGYPIEQLNKLTGKSITAMPGHGLGLTIVRQIAIAHHGRICFSNSAPRGACCVISFGRLRLRRIKPIKQTDDEA